MKERTVQFFSDGYKLQGSIYLPDNYEEGKRLPTIIPCSGYRGFNCFYPRLFSEYLTNHGFVCLGFDYRGFAESEGEVGRVILEEQIQDILNAIIFACIQPEVDAEQIGLIGWGMGASNVVRAAADEELVRAVAGINGFYNGVRWLSSVSNEAKWNSIRSELREDRKKRVIEGCSKSVDPFHHYPLDPTTKKHVDIELVNLHNFGDSVQLLFTESILRLATEKISHALSTRPVFIAHGESNKLHPPAESEIFFDSLSGPKSYLSVDGEHNDFMYRDNPVFDNLMEHVTAFFAESFGK